MPEPAILIHNDPVFGLYAHVTPGQLAVIENCFDDDEFDINPDAARRLRRAGFDLIIFRHDKSKHILGELNYRDKKAGLAASSDTPEPFHYAPNLAQLFSIGDPGHNTTGMPPDYYRQRKITPADIPGLLRMYQDPELIYMERSGGYSPACWSRAHIQRALVELRAPGAARLFYEDLRNRLNTDENDGLSAGIEDTVQLLPSLGDEACAILIAALNAHNGTASLGVRLAEMLENTGKRHPHLRDACVAAVTRQLENHPVNDPDYNGFLVSALIGLEAVETAPAIEQAYAADHVSIEICGDWEDVQIDLGLKTKRDTPESVRRDAIRAERGLPPIMNEEPFRNTAPKIGRNDPCPCGSGKKYKKCCMDKNP